MCNQQLLGPISTIFQATTAFMSGQAQASIAKANERAALQAGYAQELTFRDQARTKMGAQVNELGGRGVSISTGTPLALLRESAQNQEMDALAIRKDAQQKANNFLAQAHGAQVGAWTSAAGTILGNAKSDLADLGKIGDSASAAQAAGTITDATGSAAAMLA